LGQKSSGVIISARGYYGSVRRMIPDREQLHTNRRASCSVEEDDAGEPVKRQMIQLLVCSHGTA
jgi:hypothetical protein